MGHSDFLKLFGQLASLTQQQRAQVRSALDVLPRPSATAIASVIPSPTACPHCQAAGEQLRPWGHSPGGHQVSGTLPGLAPHAGALSPKHLSCRLSVRSPGKIPSATVNSYIAKNWPLARMGSAQVAIKTVVKISPERCKASTTAQVATETSTRIRVRGVRCAVQQVGALNKVHLFRFADSPAPTRFVHESNGLPLI